jgi:selenocysteine-specific elongation factor
LIDIARDAGLSALDTQGFVGAAGETFPEVDPRLRALVREGMLTKVGSFLVETTALERLKGDLREANGAGAPGEVEVGAFKDRFGLTRKHAIPLLEWLDRERVTRRVGATRRLL